MAEEKRRKSSLVDHSYDNTIQFRRLLSAGQRTREALVTSLLWVVYGYLWLPLISLIAWYYGIDFAYESVQKAGGAEALILMLIWFSIAFLIILLIVVSWSGYQYSRFKGQKNRRNRTPDLDAEEEREVWQIGAPLQAQIKSNKIQTVSLGADVRIKSVVAE
jgi:biofilm PGA synthesis protein PgaD